tara:strand:+ start:73 stop:312 length:240 start_codon:yes stop_codon:yes gene_type:complete
MKVQFFLSLLGEKMENINKNGIAKEAENFKCHFCGRLLKDHSRDEILEEIKDYGNYLTGRKSTLTKEKMEKIKKNFKVK